MKNLKILSKRGLALFLSLVMCLSLLPATALAAEDAPTITIYKGEGEQEILSALNEVFGVSQKWEYHATSKGSNTDKNCNKDYWFEIGTAKGIKIPLIGTEIKGYSHGSGTKLCIHTAIHLLGTGTHEGIEVKDAAGNQHHITLVISDTNRPVDKPQASIILDIPSEIPTEVSKSLGRDKVDTDITCSKILGYVTAGEGTDLSKVGNMTAYVSVGWPIASFGIPYQIWVEWEESETYAAGMTDKVWVKFVKPTTPKATMEQNDPIGDIQLVYDNDGNIDKTASEQAILDAVVKDSTPKFTLENVTIEYEATAESGVIKQWVPLTGEKKALTYPAISEGPQNIRITFNGNDAYQKTSFEVTANFIGREASEVVLFDGSTVYNKSTDAIKQYIFENCIDWTNSEIPAKENLSWSDFEYQYEATLSLIDEIGQNDQLAKYATQWVPFEGKTLKEVVSGGNDTVGGIIDGLGSLIGKIPGVDEGVMNDLIENASYPAIGAGEQKIRVIYKGNKDYAPGAFGNDTPTAVLTITKAPAKVTVNSTTIPVKDVQPGLPGFITTDPADVGTVTVYAGLNQNAKPVVYIDLSQADSVFKNLPKLLGLEDGTNVAELYKKLTDGELSKWLEKAGISSDITGKLIDAIAGVINNDTISGIISGNKDNIADLINKGLGGVGSAIEQMGDVTVYFRAPQEAGLYGVASFVSDKNYEANPNIAVGYLVITMDAIKVTVNSTSINVGDALPEDFITTDPHTDKVCAIYAGLPMGVWLDVPEAYQFAGVTNVGELQAALNAQASAGTDAVGLDYNLVNKLLEVITRLDMPGVIDSVPVHYGVPTDTAGVYTVTAIASNNGADIPGVGVGTLKVGLNQDVTVTVNDKTIYVGDEIPEDLVVTTPEDARTLVLYAGVDAGSGKLDGVVYLDGLSGAPETITIGELRQRIAGNPMLEDYRIISAILEKLPETAADNWTVKTGKPPVQAGAYTVVAGAVKSGSVPAIDVGTLTIIDKEMSMIVYVAADGNGTVRLNNQEDGGAVVFEMVPSTVQQTVGATAVVRDEDNFHFANWTKVELFKESPYSETATIQPDRPASLLGQLPALLAKLIPGIDGMLDLSKVAAIYVAHFERHVWDETERKDATCTEDGYIKSICSKTDCGATKTDVLSALGHDMTYVPGTSMDCSTNTPGVTGHWHCDRCGGDYKDRNGNDVWVAADEIIPVAHVVPTSAITPEVPATCLTDGTKAHWTCLVCGKHFADSGCTVELTDLTIPAAGHTEVTDAAVPPTCTSTGLTAGSHCSVCNTVIVAQETVPSAGHSWNEGEVTTPATCEGAGVRHVTCIVCGATEDRAISALGHTPVTDPAVDPTCTREGTTEGEHCSVCGAVITAQESVPMLPHDYDAVVTAPTCVDDGYTTHTCRNCSTSYRDSSVPALGHSFIDYMSNGDASCIENGTSTAKCERCDEVNTRVNANSKLPHTAVTDAAVAATCDAAGLTEGSHCGVCGTVLTAQTASPALGHDYSVVVTAPTCTERGYTTHVCSRNGEHNYEDSYVPATGHSWDAGVITVYPTYTSTGVRTYTCTACGATRTDTIPALTYTIPTPSTPIPTPTVTIPENSTPLGESPESLVDIDDDDVPLAMLPGLNTLDHIAYIQGYSDGTVRPMNKITRAEVATIFYRLMTDAYRAANYTTSHSFTDAPANQWYNEAIATAARAGLLKGYGDGSVRPNKNITRAEFVTIAANFLDGSGSGTTAFSDVRGHWAEADINRAVEAGWIKGDGNGNFRPDDSITRAEAVTIINRILDRATDTAEMLDSMVTWPDSRESDWWYVAVQEATNGHDYESSLPYERWTTLF